MKVRIYKPSRNAMQSGQAATEQWVLECEPKTPRTPEPLMGWTSANDTLDQVRVKFDSKEAAVAFAEEKGWTFSVAAAHARKVTPRSYLDNFRYRPVEEEK